MKAIEAPPVVSSALTPASASPVTTTIIRLRTRMGTTASPLGPTLSLPARRPTSGVYSPIQRDRSTASTTSTAMSPEYTSHDDAKTLSPDPSTSFVGRRRSSRATSNPPPLRDPSPLRSPLPSPSASPGLAPMPAPQPAPTSPNLSASPVLGPPWQPGTINLSPSTSPLLQPGSNGHVAPFSLDEPHPQSQSRRIRTRSYPRTSGFVPSPAHSTLSALSLPQTTQQQHTSSPLVQSPVQSNASLTDSPKLLQSGIRLTSSPASTLSSSTRRTRGDVQVGVHMPMPSDSKLLPLAVPVAPTRQRVMATVLVELKDIFDLESSPSTWATEQLSSPHQLTEEKQDEKDYTCIVSLTAQFDDPPGAPEPRPETPRTHRRGPPQCSPSPLVGESPRAARNGQILRPHSRAGATPEPHTPGALPDPRRVNWDLLGATLLVLLVSAGMRTQADALSPLLAPVLLLQAGVLGLGSVAAFLSSHALARKLYTPASKSIATLLDACSRAARAHVILQVVGALYVAISLGSSAHYLARHLTTTAHASRDVGTWRAQVTWVQIVSVLALPPLVLCWAAQFVPARQLAMVSVHLSSELERRSATERSRTPSPLPKGSPGLDRQPSHHEAPAPGTQGPQPGRSPAGRSPAVWR